MRRAPRSTACFVMIAVATMFAGACGSKAGDPKSEGTSTTVAADEVSLPEFGPFDTGSLDDISIDAHATRASAGAVKIRLRTCEHVAPGRWLMRGDLSATAEVSTPLIFESGFARGDQGSGVAVRATVSGRGGPFTLPIDLFARDDTKKVGLWAMDADSCSLDLADGNGSFADVTSSSVPIDYGAPAGSVQALGIGARMDRRDATFAWAYFVWSHQASPFAELWIPPVSAEQFRLSDPSDPDAPDCLAFQYAIGETLVEQSAGCRRLSGVSADPVPGAAGFRWMYSNPDHRDRTAVLIRAAYRLVVSDSDASRAAAVAASLRPVGSIVVDPAALAPPPSLAEVVDAGRLRLKAEGEFGPVGDFDERARVHHDGITTIAYTGHYAHPCSNCEDGLLGFLDVYESNGRWRYDAGSGGSFDDCLGIAGGWSTGVGTQVRVVTADPRWTIEVLDPAAWAPIHMADGVWIQDYPDKPVAESTPHVIVRDAQGAVVHCFQSASPR